MGRQSFLSAGTTSESFEMIIEAAGGPAIFNSTAFHMEVKNHRRGRQTVSKKIS